MTREHQAQHRRWDAQNRATADLQKRVLKGPGGTPLWDMYPYNTGNDTGAVVTARLDRLTKYWLQGSRPRIWLHSCKCQ